jgi:uncharacterized protein (DUF58 family)
MFARPTARGLALLVMSAFTYLAARVLGTWELYLLAFAFLAALLVSWVLVLAAARKLEATRTLTPAQPTAGDDLVLAVRVKNGSLLPGPQVSVHDTVGSLGTGDPAMEFESLAPRAERVLSGTAPPARRGVHSLPALRLEAEDPLGLAHARRRAGEAMAVTVYPRLVHLSSCALFGDTGQLRERGRGGRPALGSAEFHGIRPHNPGEPLNHVDWKATARTGSLMLREMDSPAGSEFALLLDGTASAVAGSPPDTSYELAVQAVGAVTDFALRSGRAVDLLFHERKWRTLRLTPDPGADRRLLEALAVAAPNASAWLGLAIQRLRADRGRLLRAQTVAVVALSLDPKLVHALAALRREGPAVSVILVDAGSFTADAKTNGPASRSSTSEALLLTLASAGVLCLTLRRGDDLRSALSLRREPAHRSRPA